MRSSVVSWTGWLTWLVIACAAPGVGAQVAGSGKGIRSAVEVPLRLDGGRMIVEVRTSSGTTFDFAVSVGNSVLVVSESVAARLGSAPVLTLGGLPVATDGMHTVADESLTTPSGAVAGMIGANTLSRFDILFDVPGGRLLLAETGRSVDWPGYTLSDPVPLRVFHGVVLSLDVAVDGTRYVAGLDLGSRRMLVSEPLATREGLGARDEVTLRLGSVDISRMPTQTTDHPTFARWDPTGQGFLYIGSAIVEDCPVAVSWVHRELRTCVP